MEGTRTRGKYVKDSVMKLKRIIYNGIKTGRQWSEIIRK
jgi:alkyl hydroperoxide reductase subunit AhpC